MAAIGVSINENGLLVTSDEKRQEIPLATENKELKVVKVWSNHCQAQIYEKSVNNWFSEILQTDCKLALMPEEMSRQVNYFYAVHKDDVVSFADAYPVLLIGEASLEDLNARLETTVPMNRFRPNLVVSGTEAFEEDGWKQIKIGKCVFHLVKPCGRCVMTNINQENGEKQGIEPLRTLASYRIPKRSVKKKILFGQCLIAENVGETLSIGDEIEVLVRKNKPKFL